MHRIADAHTAQTQVVHHDETHFAHILRRRCTARKSGALSCRLKHSCSAIDRHMQHAVFHTIAFFLHFHVSHFPPLQHGAAFSCSAISCLTFSASSCSEVSATVLGVCGQYWLPGCRKVIDVIRGHPYCHLWKGQKRLRTTVLQWADADGSVFYSTLWTIKKCTLLIFNINFSNVD